MVNNECTCCLYGAGRNDFDAGNPISLVAISGPKIVSIFRPPSPPPSNGPSNGLSRIKITMSKWHINITAMLSSKEIMGTGEGSCLCPAVERAVRGAVKLLVKASVFWMELSAHKCRGISVLAPSLFCEKDLC